MSLKHECHLNWNVIWIDLTWNTTQIEVELKFECNSNLNATKIEMSLKFERHSNWNVF